jgi:hypothetical protein
LIRAAESDAEVTRWLAIRNEIFPTIAISRAVLDVQDRHGPAGRLKLLAGDVGFAIVTPAHPDAAGSARSAARPRWSAT